MRAVLDIEEEEDEESVPLSHELYLMLPEYLTKIQECATCGIFYKECHNIGRHKCLIHPGVRLLTNDLIPQRAFYSCCGHSLLAKGCLQIDHAAYIFSETSATKRFAQIRDFSTMIVPHILLRFITRPLPNALLYDTTAHQCKRNNNNVFKYRFAVLKEVSERSNALLLTHELQLVSPVWECEKENEDADVSMVEFDVEAEAYGLFLSSKESPLFSILAARSMRGKTRNAMLKDCESAWRSQLGRNAEDDEGGAYSSAGKDERVQFVIIGRMNTVLDVDINIKL